VSDDRGNAFERVATGIAGFDSLTGGGLPARRVTLIAGGPGAGKTVFGLQVLCHAAAAGESGLLVSFEESAAEVVENHAGFSWNLSALAGDRVHIIEARVDEAFAGAGQFDIGGLLAAMGEKVRQTGATWVMLDGLDALLGALGGQQAALREIYRLRRWVSGQGVTCLVTGKVDADLGDYLRRFSFMPFAVDCLVSLRSEIRERAFMRQLCVVKYRGGACSGAEVPFVISGDGITPALRESVRLEHEVSTERVGTGIPRLDRLLDGGYLRGSSVLVSGAPGTAKTTLAAALADHACRQGEPALFVSFDEAGSQIVRNVRSVGIDLQQHVDSGLLQLTGFRAAGVSAEEHFIAIQRMLLDHRPRYLIIDPVSALVKAGGRDLAADVAERILETAKARGTTVMTTTLLEEGLPEAEDTMSHVSTIADTWINLSYNVGGGERNRALTVIKARGTAHSNQVRELVLGSGGITLADVYTAGGDVLMGTARIERESEEQLDMVRRDAEYQIQREKLEAEVREAEERIRTLSEALQSYRHQLELMTGERNALENARARRHGRVRENRHADDDVLEGARGGEPRER